MSLTVGNKAPAFEGRDQDGNIIRLADYSGKKLVLYFYPKDDTSGCTAQACNLRDSLPALKSAGYEIVGVSVDNEKSHLKFISKYNLNFPLIADTEHQLVQAFEVWKEKSMYGKKYMGTVRTTFLIDESGTITRVIDQVKTGEHAAQILNP
jgi:peroxiredoxin Q/BCP